MKKNKISSLQSLLREKAKIEESIMEEYKEYVTIMFTDIAGYTSYVETHGDLAAKSLLQQHNDFLFPLIKENGGQVVKTIGDAVMASFAKVEDGARAAVSIQKKLAAYNRNADTVKQIHIRIGLHAGQAIRDGNDYFGDVVNVAARIEPTGKAGQIRVSDTVFKTIKNDGEFFFSHYGEKKAKGKAAPLSLYRLFLSREEQREDKRKKEKKALEEKKGQDVELILEKKIIRYDLIWKTSIPVFLFVLLLFNYPGIFNFQKSNGKLLQYSQAFDRLRAGDFEMAKNLFTEIGGKNPLCKEGLAALAYKKRSFNQAETLCDESMALNHDILYPRVIKGNILFDSGKTENAFNWYKEALGLNTPLSWQKGEAYFRMGRISSAQGDSRQALDYYNKALSLDQRNPDILTAKGVILESLGNLEEALPAFQAAYSFSPDNRMAKAFFRRIQDKLANDKNKARKKRIDELVSQLIETMHQKRPKETKDSWTSRPITLFFAKEDRTGALTLNEGEDEYFEMELVDRLVESGAVEMVEREILEKLLEELKLGSSALADQRKALELGKIVSARLIGRLKFLGYGGRTRVSLRLIETETSALKAGISGEYGKDAAPGETARKMAGEIAEKIRTTFPKRGKIISMEGGTATLNIGSRTGITKGTICKVYGKGTIPDDVNKKIIGALKVIEVKEETSTGEVLKETEPIQTQYLVEAQSS